MSWDLLGFPYYLLGSLGDVLGSLGDILGFIGTSLGFPWIPWGVLCFLIEAGCCVSAVRRKEGDVLL